MTIVQAAYEVQKKAVEEARERSRQKGMNEKKLEAKWWRGEYLWEALRETRGAPHSTPIWSTTQIKTFLKDARNLRVEDWRYGPGYRGGASRRLDTAYWHVDFQDDMLKVRPTSLVEYEALREELVRKGEEDGEAARRPTSLPTLREELLAEARRALDARPVGPTDEEWETAPEARAVIEAVYWQLRHAIEDRWLDDYPEVPDRLRDFDRNYIRRNLPPSNDLDEKVGQILERVRTRRLHFIPARAKFEWILRMYEWLKLQKG